jgi:uncharacterized protein
MINRETQAYIRAKLDDLAKLHNIIIIHAVESGSRAWGFPSKDSDYDVRFIYAHDLGHYLCVDHKRDVIEAPILHDDFLGVEFDLKGWDIKKAIYLALRGNVVVNEWLTSPIRYIYNNHYYNDLVGFINEVSELTSYLYFYRNHMHKPWNSYSREKSEPIKIKHYCYVMRCALSLKWLEKQKTSPPMDVPSLLKGIDLDKNLRNEINLLISSKAESVESSNMPRSAILDDFIDNAISEERERLPKDEQQKRNIDKANALFKKIVLG